MIIPLTKHSIAIVGGMKIPTIKTTGRTKYRKETGKTTIHAEESQVTHPQNLTQEPYDSLPRLNQNLEFFRV